MNLTRSTVLITGGSDGIGFSLAERFMRQGNTVIVCGRQEQKLHEAQNQLPGLITRICDVTNEEDRKSLFKWVTTHHPEVNVLVNNAGILRRFELLETDATNDWHYYGKEITVNTEGPIHLSMMFAQYFSKKENGAIVNITSGLAFTPDPYAPIYSATKAAIHSFSVSLRHQLSETPVEVIEIAPPLVNTGDFSPGTVAVPVTEFIDAVFAGLRQGKYEIGYESTENSFRMSRDEIDKTVKNIFSKKNNQSFGD